MGGQLVGATLTLFVAVQEYLGEEHSWSAREVESAFAAELAAQSRVCSTPAVDAGFDDWPADLVEALGRRVAHNLELRRLPLGLKATVTEMAAANTRVGGEDAEVRRLEAPFKPVVFG